MFGRLFILLALSGLLLQSCQQDVQFDQDIFKPVAVTGDMKAKIDGVQWVANKAAFAYRMTGRIDIAGLSADRKLLNISLVDSGVHRYTLNSTSLNVVAYQDSAMADVNGLGTNDSDDPSLAGGEVNVTSIDTTNKKISGTFSFRAYREYDGIKRNFTEGSFTNISYQTSLPSTPSNSVDSFRVKINGVDFLPKSLVSVSAFGNINISASTLAAFPNVGLTVPATITPGSYSMDFFGMQYIGIYNPDADGTHAQASDSGTLTILEHNTSTKRIRGTFNFIAKSILDPSKTANLTEGYFSFKY